VSDISSFGRASTRLVPRVAEQDIEVAGDLSERPKEESNLTSMVNSMDCGVVHQIPKSECVRPTPERECHDPAEIFICQV
jgi:hypothetical protein